MAMSTEPQKDDTSNSSNIGGSYACMVVLMMIACSPIVDSFSLNSCITSLGGYLLFGAVIDFWIYGNLKPSSLKTVVAWFPRGTRAFWIASKRHKNCKSMGQAFGMIYPDRKFFMYVLRRAEQS